MKDMEKLSRFIVKQRNRILILAIILVIPSILGFIDTGVNYDILSYLPSEVESMRAQSLLGDEFNLASVDMLVVNGMKDKDVVKLKKEIQQVDGVAKVYWRDDVLDITIPKEAIPERLNKFLYSDDSTMMIITFEEGTASQRTLDAIAQIKKIAAKDCFLGGMSAIAQDTKEMVDNEILLYSGIAILLVLVVLWLGLESNAAPFVFMLGIAFPIIYNFGTNIFLGEISYITQALTLVLQLAVTMDYSIFLLHRYQEEKKHNESKEEAMSKAIQATFVSISSSSITTIAGFVALCIMRLTLGRDIGVVMAKGVILGVISTILILPSLLMIFDDVIERHKHKVIIKELKTIPAWVVDHAKVLLLVFAVSFGPLLYAQANTNKYYDLIAGLPQDFQSVIGTNQLKEKFNMTTTHFIIVDDKLKAHEIEEMCDEIEKVDGINNVLSYQHLIGPGVSSVFEPKVVSDILHKGNHILIMANSDYTSASDEENAQIDKIDKIIHKYDKNAVIGGEGALTKDLIEVTDIDFKMVNIVSILMIFIIIAITFKSISLPVILVGTIEFAIAINMGIPYFTHTTLPFIASIVIGTIQLGATVDYAILLTSRFREEIENGKRTKEALKTAIRHSSTSIMTSGGSFFAACMGVALLARMDLLKSMCFLLARGALVSVVCIILILPAFLLLGQSLIEKTTKGWPKAVEEKRN